MKIGLALPHYDFSFPAERRATVRDVVEYGRRAEDLGFDSVWVSDHLFLDLARYGGPAHRYGTPEALTMLAALAGATERVRIGSLVLCAAFRNARILAAQARSIDEMSGGRLELGLGSGWYQAEFDEAGIPFETPGRRIERLARAAAVLGECGVRAPLWIGGKGGPKIMRIVAEYADGWNVCWRITPEEYRARASVLDEACARAGRDPGSVSRSVGLYTLLGSDRADLERRYERLRAWMPGIVGATPLDEFARGALVGTPEECAARVKEFEALGVDHVIVSLASLPFAVYDDEQLEPARALMALVR